MTSLMDRVFGGTDDSSQEAQIQSNNDAKRLIAANTEQAREDILRLFPASEQATQLSSQAALDVFGQSIPQQVTAFQGGNVAAQETLIGGLPQQINAIRGTPVDLSGLQPQQIGVDTSFAQQQLPQFQTSAEALPGAVNASTMGRIQTNADLFRAASLGEIPGISQGDQNFFRKHLKNVLASPNAGAGTGLVTDPNQRGFVGREGGFNPENERKLANLLTNFQALGGGA